MVFILQLLFKIKYSFMIIAVILNIHYSKSFISHFLIHYYFQYLFIYTYVFKYTLVTVCGIFDLNHLFSNQMFLGFFPLNQTYLFINKSLCHSHHSSTTLTVCNTYPLVYIDRLIIHQNTEESFGWVEITECTQNQWELN